MYQIEKGIPLPARTNYKTTGGYACRLRSMAVNDSTLFSKPTASEINSIKTTMKRLRKKEGVQFALRTIAGDCRVWRTK